MVLKFRKNPIYTDSRYDLVSKVSTVLTWIKLSKPQKNVFAHNGAKYILESWNNGDKILFTGLRVTKNPNQYKGDHLNRATGVKYDLLATMYIDQETITLQLKERAITTMGNSSFIKFRNRKGRQL